MKRIFKIIIIAIALTLASIASVIAYAVVYGPEFNASSKEFINSNLPKLAAENFSGASNWYQDNSSCTSSGSQSVSEKLNNKLGIFKSITSTDGSFELKLFPYSVSANYVVGMAYEKSSAVAHVKVVRNGGKWKFNSISIESMVFCKNGG